MKKKTNKLLMLEMMKKIDPTFNPKLKSKLNEGWRNVTNDAGEPMGQDYEYDQNDPEYYEQDEDPYMQDRPQNNEVNLEDIKMEFDDIGDFVMDVESRVITNKQDGTTTEFSFSERDPYTNYGANIKIRDKNGDIKKVTFDSDPEEIHFKAQELYKYLKGGGLEEEMNLDDEADWAKDAEYMDYLNEKDDKWIQNAVNPDHEGYCTPMTKDTCTPARKAFAKRAKAGDLEEVFGWSGKEKEAKANQQKLEQAKQEILKYPPTHLFSQPAQGASQQDNKKLMDVRINMASQAMPTLAELMPQLFDLNQSFSGANQLYNGKKIYGLIPTNWYYFVRGADGFIDNDRAVEKLNQEIDAMGKKGGMQEGAGYDEYLKRYHDRLKEMNAHPELLKHITIDQVNKAASDKDIETIDTVYELLFNKA